ncbi:helix-turn-helix transcriptional regulator [Streptococcus salivarius]|uniref:helix-turn-helix transcriptional regulator n=1 Tax=Streptococcus salivarius TaxID=1304 RepID=UPI0039C30A3E
MLKDNIKKARLDAGLTQLEVAEKLGVAQAQYARWENGGRNPRKGTVEKLAEIFGTSYEILKGRDDGLEDIVNLLREYELTEEEKKEIIIILKQFLMKKGMI